MHRRDLDLSTIISMSLSLGMILLAVLLEGEASSFLDFPSFLIVIMGSLLVTISCFSFSDFFTCLPIIYYNICFKPRSIDLLMINLLKFAQELRLGKSNQEVEKILQQQNFDMFFLKAFQMIQDGISQENIEKIMHQEMNSNILSYNKVILLMRKAAETAPAMGLIGTLIGLVQMLKNLSNPSQLGSAMAIALLTTFYGAVLSYMVFFPLASKLERNSKEESLLQLIYLKTAISIANKENPRYLEITLNSLLDESQKINYFKGTVESPSKKSTISTMR
jgi:chemotaxis protein MotA